MFRQIYYHTYGFISVGILELGKLIENFNNLLNIVVLVIQIIIAALTIYKLYIDIKNKKFKTVENSEKSIEQKHKFLFAILKYFSKWKSK